MPERKPSPVEKELDELKEQCDRLDKSLFNLVDRLTPVLPNPDTQAEQVADGPAMEPATSCYLKDRLADRKQHIAYMQRRIMRVIDSLFI